MGYFQGATSKGQIALDDDKSDDDDGNEHDDEGNDGDEHNDDEDHGKQNDVGDGKWEQQQQPADSIPNLLNKYSATHSALNAGYFEPQMILFTTNYSSMLPMRQASQRDGPNTPSRFMVDMTYAAAAASIGASRHHIQPQEWQSDACHLYPTTLWPTWDLARMQIASNCCLYVFFVTPLRQNWKY